MCRHRLPAARQPIGHSATSPRPPLDLANSVREFAYQEAAFKYAAWQFKQACKHQRQIRLRSKRTLLRIRRRQCSDR